MQRNSCLHSMQFYFVNTWLDNFSLLSIGGSSLNGWLQVYGSMSYCLIVVVLLVPVGCKSTLLVGPMILNSAENFIAKTWKFLCPLKWSISRVCSRNGRSTFTFTFTLHLLYKNQVVNWTFAYNPKSAALFTFMKWLCRILSIITHFRTIESGKQIEVMKERNRKTETG